GTASGINNTTARVAGLLSIAVLGLVMMSAFRSHLNRHLADLPIPAPAMRELQLNENRLAAMTIPAGLDADVAADIRFAVDQAFVFASRRIMLTCAALCIAGATLAWRILRVLEETLIAGSGALVQP